VHAVLASCAGATQITGLLKTDAPWAFLGKFCFNPSTKDDPGVFNFHLTYPENSTLVLNVYWYSGEQWGRVYQAGGRSQERLSCRDKVKVAEDAGNRFDVHNRHWTDPKTLTAAETGMMEAVPGTEDMQFLKAIGSLTFTSNRERWYYFALSNCADECVGRPDYCNGELLVGWNLTFTNGVGWDAAITADEQGIAEASITLFVFWALGGCCVLSVQLFTMAKRKMMHTTVRILVQAFLCHLLELFFCMVYYVAYISTGNQNRGLRIVYRCFAAFAETHIVLFLILIAKGWTVVRRKITPQGRVKITAFIAVYGVIQFGIVTWEATVGSDPADITWLYESPPGFVLLCLRLYALMWFIRAILITRHKYTRKRGFYWKFAVAGSFWMFALPLEVLIASRAVPVYRRPRFVFAFNVTVNALFFILQFYLFNPSRYNRAFPFHAKTSDMEARPPQSTRWGPARPGRPQRGTGRASGGGTVEMTANGPVFSNPGPTNGSAARRRAAGGRTNMSGGLGMETPEERVRSSMLKIRAKIAQLTDHSDDLEYALDELNLHEWDSAGDEAYDLPEATVATPSAGRGPHPPQAPPAE
jgi:hypothetical protein